ncbi:hypothetical protein APB26_31705 [Pseudomonas aeruginosa]|uniref:hypothetical protein n=1 Tax=Pseudomonas aeruginosa TaxID=287 RepID=UPI00071BC1CD|nr:hypothetical protein [Pseudomonas aeruginosa]KSQ21556.1 hypothetical protein APB26_31705 [Pseudomonas aeruginosa]RPV61224.1 hypothetical protein IPC838_18030 [Pseudomonas aeruginosa]
MTRTTLLIALAVLTIVLSIAGLAVCAFGVIEDLDALVLTQSASLGALIAVLYGLAQVDGKQVVQSGVKEDLRHA